MKTVFFKFLFASLVTLGLLVGATLNASAARVPKFLTKITFTNQASVNLGKPFIVSGYLRTWYGAPVPAENVELKIGGVVLGPARTDSTGFFLRKFTKKYSAGTYALSAITNLSTHYFGTSSSMDLVILPADVRVRTVPAIPGLAFNLAGHDFVSGPDGVADIKVGTIGTYQLTVLVDQYSNPNLRIELARWLDETYKTYQIVKVPSNTNKVIEVGLNVYHKVGQSFADLKNFPVSPERVSEFTIRSAQGDLFVLKDGQPRWIPASRIARRASGLEATPLLYSVISMVVDGANVVNRSQQRFYTSPNGTWQISLILYTLTVRANDGLFGSTVGNSINLVYPDGHIENFPFDKTGTVVMHSLARGNYTVQVIDAKGLRQVIPVALSRSQTVDIKVPTTLDLIVLISFGLFTALGLILFGRLLPQRSLARKSSPVFQLAQLAFAKSGAIQEPEGKAETSRNEMNRWS